MVNKKVKKAAKITGLILAFLIAVLAVHIYVVTRPKADAHTMIMARLDFKQSLTPSDASVLYNWLSQQKGVNHVVCMPQSKMVLFTFFPLQAKADHIVANLNNTLPYKATRYVPTDEEISEGCPVLGKSFTSSVYRIMKHI